MTPPSFIVYFTPYTTVRIPGSTSVSSNGKGQSGYGLINTGPFNNLVSAYYWSSTDYSTDPSCAWAFATFDGSQNVPYKNLVAGGGLAVLPGNIAAAQAPDLKVVGTGTMQGVTGSYQLIYDGAQNITWLDYTHWDTTNNGNNYNDTWQNQVNWAQNLTVNFNGLTITGWSLPTTTDGSTTWTYYDGTTSAGVNKTNSQMGYLYYTELGNKGVQDINGNLQTGWGLTNTGPFKNLLSYPYWSVTEHSADPALAWAFATNSGSQYATSTSDYSYGLAVLPGDISAVQAPQSPGLFRFQQQARGRHSYSKSRNAKLDWQYRNGKLQQRHERNTNSCC